MLIEVKQLPSGWWHVRGRGPCNWSQPMHWPCDEETLRRCAHPEASEEFIREAFFAAESKRARPGGES